MFGFGPNLAIKTQERLSNPQNTVQHDSKMKREISPCKSFIGYEKVVDCTQSELS